MQAQEGVALPRKHARVLRQLFDLYASENNNLTKHGWQMLANDVLRKAPRASALPPTLRMLQLHDSMPQPVAFSVFLKLLERVAHAWEPLAQPTPLLALLHDVALSGREVEATLLRRNSRCHPRSGRDHQSFRIWEMAHTRAPQRARDCPRACSVSVVLPNTVRACAASIAAAAAAPTDSSTALSRPTRGAAAPAQTLTRVCPAPHQAVAARQLPTRPDGYCAIHLKRSLASVDFASISSEMVSYLNAAERKADDAASKAEDAANSASIAADAAARAQAVADEVAAAKRQVDNAVEASAAAGEAAAESACAAAAAADASNAAGRAAAESARDAAKAAVATAEAAASRSAADAATYAAAASQVAASGGEPSSLVGNPVRADAAASIVRDATSVIPVTPARRLSVAARYPNLAEAMSESPSDRSIRSSRRHERACRPRDANEMMRSPIGRHAAAAKLIEGENRLLQTPRALDAAREDTVLPPRHAAMVKSAEVVQDIEAVEGGAGEASGVARSVGLSSSYAAKSPALLGRARALLAARARRRTATAAFSPDDF